jgi:hypothetical protein
MKKLKHIKRFNESSENLNSELSKDSSSISDVSDSKKLTMIFGNDNTIFKKFDDEYPGDIDFLKRNDGKVNLSYIGFAEEWSDWVDFEKSYAYIDDSKLYVVVYGLPENINKKSVEDYFGKTLEQYIKKGYGEFFETEPGCPICMIVVRNGKEVIV